MSHDPPDAQGFSGYTDTFLSSPFSALDTFGLDESFDPLSDSELDTDDEDFEESIELIGPGSLSVRPGSATKQVDTRSAQERIADLLKAMAPHRKALYGILAFCLKPHLAKEVDGEVERLKEHSLSVFSAANLTNLLEQSGGIRRVAADGSDYNQNAKPQLVEEEGIPYLRPGQAPDIYWVTTAEGRAALEADNPLQRLRELFATDSRYLPIYKRILTLCKREGGVSVRELGIHVDDDPLTQKPRLYAPRFLDRLEKCDAVIWRGNWIITNIGTSALEFLDTTRDDYAMPTSETVAAKLAPQFTVPAIASAAQAKRQADGRPAGLP
ncbi:MAG: hypothetical protein LBU07_01685 [Coriobacteriales bacterium]|jgi:hypothetical protein|nr:hypothetical protein [Coriobacteriales bacterium]